MVLSAGEFIHERRGCLMSIQLGSSIISQVSLTGTMSQVLSFASAVNTSMRLTSNEVIVFRIEIPLIAAETALYVFCQGTKILSKIHYICCVMRLLFSLISLILFTANTATMADTHIYRGRYTNTSDIVCTWDGEHLYNGRYSNTSAILYTWDGKHLYHGRYTNTSAILYTWDGRHVYRGRYTNTSDILYTWDGKHIYKGRYTNMSDILYTFDGKHLYRGRYTNTSDILMTFNGPVPVPVMLLALL